MNEEMVKLSSHSSSLNINQEEKKKLEKETNSSYSLNLNVNSQFLPINQYPVKKARRSKKETIENNEEYNTSFSFL